jgi:hypothetical protein
MEADGAVMARLLGLATSTRSCNVYSVLQRLLGHTTFRPKIFKPHLAHSHATLQLTRSLKARGSIPPLHSRALSFFNPATRCVGDALLYPGQRPFLHIAQEADSWDMVSCLSSAANRIIASPKRFSATRIPLAYSLPFLTLLHVFVYDTLFV